MARQPSSIPNGIPSFLEQNQMTSLMAEQASRFFKAQEAMLSDFENLSHKWYERRREAAKAAVEAADRLSHSDNMAEGMQALNGWLSQSMARLGEDAQDNYQTMMRCFTRMAETVPDAAANLSTVAGGGTKAA